MLRKPHKHCTPSVKSFPSVALETVLVFVFSDGLWLFLILSKKIFEHFLFLDPSPPGRQWCDVLGFVSVVSQAPQHYSPGSPCPEALACQACVCMHILVVIR